VGPKGFTNSFEEFDLRSGEAWRLIMHGPDVIDYHPEVFGSRAATANRDPACTGDA